MWMLGRAVRRARLPRRVAAWIAAGLLGVPSAVGAVFRLASVAAGDRSWSQFVSETMSSLLVHAAVVAAVLAAVAWSVRVFRGKGPLGPAVGVFAGTVVLTWSWLGQTAGTPLSGMLSGPLWLAGLLLGLNAVLLWRWWSLVAGVAGVRARG